MTAPALVRAGTIGAAPILAFGLPVAGLGAWLADAGLIVLPLMVASLGFLRGAFGAVHEPRPARPRFTKKA